MNVSGIVVGLAPAAFAPSLAALGALPGVRVHQQDRKASRVVVTQEARTSEEQEEGPKPAKQMPSQWNAPGKRASQEVTLLGSSATDPGRDQRRQGRAKTSEQMQIPRRLK